jgi:hypothetical protein
MKLRRTAGQFLLMGAVFLITSCQESDFAGGGGFQKQYFAARGALANGHYARAIRAYETMLRSYGNGPLAARLQLEYAHSLLRAERNDDAVRQAGAIVATQSGATKAAAQAVQGSAQHEMAIAAIGRGDYGPNVEANLKAALQALKAMRASHKDLDPLGSMADRITLIKSDLTNLKQYRSARG